MKYVDIFAVANNDCRVIHVLGVFMLASAHRQCDSIITGVLENACAVAVCKDKGSLTDSEPKWPPEAEVDWGLRLPVARDRTGNEQ